MTLVTVEVAFEKSRENTHTKQYKSLIIQTRYGWPSGSAFSRDLLESLQSGQAGRLQVRCKFADCKVAIWNCSSVFAVKVNLKTTVAADADVPRIRQYSFGKGISTLPVLPDRIHAESRNRRWKCK